MINLNDIKAIKGLDKANMLSSIEAFPDQCQQAWEEATKVSIPESYKKIKNIVVSGMGGSALGAHVIKSLYSKEMAVPLEIINNYHLPFYINEESLVILSSYSGSTEETLATAWEAKEKKAKILGITSGGKLGEFLKENNLPGFIFEPKFNPCGQPRMGLGYSIGGQIGLFKKTGILNVKEKDFYQGLNSLIKNKNKIKESAKEMAEILKDKIPLSIAAEFLSGNAHVLANQINENAKVMSFYFIIPELNHHLLEGLKNPETGNFFFLFLSSNLYSERIRKRFFLTKEVVKKNGVGILEFKPLGRNKFSQILETLWFGSFLSFYLAIIYGINPSPIPWVDYFKHQLEKRKDE